MGDVLCTPAHSANEAVKVFAALASALATYEAAVALATDSMNCICKTHPLFDPSTPARVTDQPAVPLPVIEVRATLSKLILS